MMTTRMLFPGTPAMRAIDRLLDETVGAPTARWTPALDITETEAGYTLTVDLPGVAADSLSIGVERGVLTLKGERAAAAAAAEPGHRWHRAERITGAFVRQVTLPSHVDTARIAATLEHGVLTVTLPKAESAKPRQVPITVPSAAPVSVN